MGVLQEIFAGNKSSDVVCATGYNRMVPLDEWIKQVNASSAGKSGPVKIIAIGKTEIDRILDGLGVIRRDRGGRENICGTTGGRNSGHARRVVGVGKVLEVQK